MRPSAESSAEAGAAAPEGSFDAQQPMLLEVVVVVEAEVKAEVAVARVRVKAVAVSEHPP